MLLPNGIEKTRTLRLLEPRDELLLLRLAAGRAVEAARGLVDRSRVFSFETRSRSGSWCLHRKGIDWHGLHRKGLKVVTTQSPAAVLQRDVFQYYGSCTSQNVGALLRERLRLPEPLVDLVVERLRVWESSGHSGLPIGPEFSAVVGTAYLVGVDDVLAAHPEVIHHLRVTDDYFIALRSASAEDEVDGVLMSRLADLGLELNTSKSESLTPDEAVARFEQRSRQYWKAQMRETAEESADERMLEALMEVSQDPLADEYRTSYVLSAASRRGLRSAIASIVDAPLVLELWPTQCGDLLAASPEATRRQLDDVFAILDGPATVRTAARDLHLVRGIALQRLGTTEGEVLVRIASDPTRPIPVRMWALHVGARTPALSLDDCADLALDEDLDLWLRRSAIVSFRGHDSNVRRLVMSDGRIAAGPLRYSGRWALAA